MNSAGLLPRSAGTVFPMLVCDNIIHLTCTFQIVHNIVEMNNSTVNSATVNHETWSRQLLPRSEGIGFFTVAIVESLAIMIGNAIVIAVFTRNRRLRKRTFYLVINLAIVDFLVGATAVPWWVGDLPQAFDLWEIKWNVEMYDNVVTNLNLFVDYASLVSLMVISLERMYATLWPVKHRALGTRTYYVLIGLSWFVAFCLLSFGLVLWFIFPSDLYAIYIHLSLILSLIVMTCVGYISIWVKIKFGGHPEHHVTTAQDRKLTVSLFIVTAFFLVTWLPTMIVFYYVIFIEYRNGVIPRSLILSHYFASLLFYVNSLVNPIIYAFKIPQFRQATFRLLCRRLAERQVQPGIGMRNEAEVINH